MARPLRLQFPDALYHLTARGNGRADIFADDDDRTLFVGLLGKEIRQQGWRCYAYCLMNNHYHLLIDTPQANLVAGMRRLNGVYTQAFNRRHGRVGHLFQGRYKSLLVDKDSYALELCRYIALNPVRAHLVKRAADWAWSSYRATVGDAVAPDWLDAAWVLRQFSGGNPKRAYEEFVMQGLEQGSPWKNVSGQIWLGNASFLDRMQTLVQAMPAANVPHVQRHPACPTAEAITATVIATYELQDEKDLLSRRHQEAFQAWAYLLRRAANLPLQVVADCCKVSPSRISKIQRALETAEPSMPLRRLMGECKVKNRPRSLAALPYRLPAAGGCPDPLS